MDENFDTNPSAVAQNSDVGSFPIPLLDSLATVYGIQRAASWYDFNAKSFSAPYDPAKHRTAVRPHEFIPNAKWLDVPPGINDKPFTVWGWAGDDPKAVLAQGYGVEGVPWGFPSGGTLKLNAGAYSAVDGTIALK